MLSTTVSAQDMPLPVDKDVRIGKLPNGLTYYIRHNEKPKGQADFYIAQKVGSILEEDNQRGLAHFLEHMCFNGTKNFPGNQIINWLETVGVKFGYNLNAYTSVDETVYNISNVPVAREEVQDSCLLILHDWANDLLLEDEEIDKERGVIHQEWRSRNVGQMRILENLLPTIYPDSKYAYRMPIGTMEVVDNFPYQALRDYYEAWYRPDQQGIIVVGDIDVDRIEGKIKEMFSEIEMPENAAERVYFPVPDNKGTIYAIGADPEQTNALVWLYFKRDPFPKEMKGNVSYLVQKYVMNMITSMLNQRLSDLANKPDAPFAQAFSMDDDFLISKTKDAFAMVGVGKDANLVPVLQALYREALRAKQSGFTVGEYQRAQQEYLSQLERAYNNRNDRENEPYVKEYVRNFIDNEPIPSIEDEYQMMQMIVPMINVDIINQVLPELITDDNRVVWALLPEKEGVAVPTEAEFAAAMTAVDGETLEAYVDEMKAEPLIPNLPAPGKIVSEKALAQWDATELTLSNGVKVIVKPTKFKADEIMFNGIGFSGTGLLPASNDTDIKNIELVLSSNGLGDYTEIDLQKYLSGKQAVVGLEVGNFETEISGSTTPKDLPTLMELLYMTMTNVTITEDEFKSLQSKYAGILRNQESNPDYIFGRDAMKSLFDSPRRLPITSEDVEAANRENILNIIHNATANAADFTFVFVGNIDMDTFRPLVEQYIATLPADASKAVKEMGFDAALQPRNGKINDAYNTKMQTPQTTALIMASGTLPYSSKGTKVASIAGQILSKRLLDTVREEMGAVYSIGASGSLGRNPGKNASLASQFPMKPEMKQEVLDFIAAEIERMQSNVTQEELNKVVEFMVKSANEGKEQNSSWLSAIGGWLENGVDTFNNNVAELQSITTDDIQQFLKDLMAQGNYAIVVLDPEAE
ncbi:MAG: insulinase family protein [Barnesiella sp.]|nr:insulinase family protein [Barnesiella sp.]